jgi:hypothetical protein
VRTTASQDKTRKQELGSDAPCLLPSSRPLHGGLQIDDESKNASIIRLTRVARGRDGLLSGLARFMLPATHIMDTKLVTTSVQCRSHTNKANTCFVSLHTQF